MPDDVLHNPRDKYKWAFHLCKPIVCTRNWGAYRNVTGVLAFRPHLRSHHKYEESGKDSFPTHEKCFADIDRTPEWMAKASFRLVRSCLNSFGLYELPHKKFSADFYSAKSMDSESPLSPQAMKQCSYFLVAAKLAEPCKWAPVFSCAEEIFFHALSFS